MRIKIFDKKHQPLLNSNVSLQIKGEETGPLSLTTDSHGELQLNEKYKGQQITIGNTGQWTVAKDGVSLTAQQ